MNIYIMISVCVQSLFSLFVYLKDIFFLFRYYLVLIVTFLVRSFSVTLLGFVF